MIPELMNCPHLPDGWCLDCLKTLIPRAEVAAALPSTWYSDRPVEFRVRILVEQWQKLHQREKEVADALEALRVTFERRSDESNWPDCDDLDWRAAFDLALTELDATIAALNLPVAKAGE